MLWRYKASGKVPAPDRDGAASAWPDQIYHIKLGSGKLEGGYRRLFSLVGGCLVEPLRIYGGRGMDQALLASCV